MQTMKGRGRACGTKRTASMTIAPNLYFPLTIAVPIAAKSLPSCDARAPQTFSRTTTDGARTSLPSFCTRHQKGQKVPERSPFRPALEPASDKSWQGNEAQARLAAPGDRKSVWEG